LAEPIEEESPMKKILFITTVAMLTIVFFAAAPFAPAQKRKQSFPGHSSVSYIEREAESEARDLWNSRITKCGGDYYARDKDHIYQFKNSRITVSVNSRRAGRRNRVEYAGYTHFKVGLSRAFSRFPRHYQNAGWSRWHDGFQTRHGTFSLTMYLRKEDGYWEAEPLSTSQLNNLQPVDCREIYGNTNDFYRRNDSYNEDFDSYRDDDSYRNDNYDRDDDSRQRYDSDNRYDNSYNGERRINWVRVTRGQSVPDRAITGGVESGGDGNGAALYVCRADYNGDRHPGKLLDGSCHIVYGGKEIVFSDYEAATGSGNWGKPAPGYAGALIGGREKGRALYVCRANFRELIGSRTINYRQYPGKVVNGRCSFAFGTMELTSDDFDVFYPNSNNANSY
jgi:hypothetical protein